MLAFAFMDIKSASGYLKHGYRIRRANWDEGEYLYNDYWVAQVVMAPTGLTKNKHPFHSDWRPEADDLIADDWELILEGIVSNYGKVKYEDEK